MPVVDNECEQQSTQEDEAGCGYWGSSGRFVRYEAPHAEEQRPGSYALLTRRLRTEAFVCSACLCIVCWPLFWLPCALPSCYEDVWEVADPDEG